MKISIYLKYLIGIVLALCLAITACGSTTSSTSSSSGGSSGGDSGSSDDDSGSSGGDSGSNGGSGGSTSSFYVTGQLTSVTLSAASPLLKTNGESETVTDVLAVSPETGNITCRVVDILDDGSFSVPIGAGSFWSFYFLNRQRRGRSMFLGWFRSTTLDTFITNSSSGNVNLGRISIDTTEGVATSDQEESDIIDDLGIDSGDAETIGEQDDFAGRYSNPDADNDGELDCNQTNASFMLDFHVRFNMLIGSTNAAVNDITDNFYDETTTTPSYTSTGVYISYLNSYSSAATGTVEFSDSDVKMEDGTTYTAGTEIDDNAADNSFGDYNSFGVNLASDAELPDGAVVFSFGAKEVTFTNVVTPSLAELNAPSGRIFPFFKFNKSDSECTEDCSLSSVSYKWMKKTAGGWTEATLSELGLFVKADSGGIGFRIGGDANKYISFKIPETSVSGTIDWEADNAVLSGSTEAEFNSFVTSQICHIGLSFDDKLGMRYFQNITNSDEDCSS